MQSELTNERHAFVSTELADRREFVFALAAVLVSTVIFLAAAPFAKARRLAPSVSLSRRADRSAQCVE